MQGRLHSTIRLVGYHKALNIFRMPIREQKDIMQAASKVSDSQRTLKGQETQRDVRSYIMIHTSSPSTFLYFSDIEKTIFNIPVAQFGT